MVNQNQVDHTVDRLVDLDGIPAAIIQDYDLGYLLDDDYLTPEALLLHQQEVTAYKDAARDVYKMYGDCLDRLIKKKRLSVLGFPQEMNELIEFSWRNKHQHILGRFDFAGGVDGGPIRLLEYNADTPTMVPESSVVQQAFKDHYSNAVVPQFNFLFDDMVRAFRQLAEANQDSHHSMLFTTLGYHEDIANARLIMKAAEQAGFSVDYADLPDIEFAPEEGIFLHKEDGAVQFDYLYKLVPWEFICFEEPELLSVLHHLITRDLVYVINPPYALAFQSKACMVELHDMFPRSPLLLPTAHSAEDLAVDKYVEKVTFGRLGENIMIYDRYDGIVESTDGDFGHYPTIFQSFAELYTDDDGDRYQAGVFTVDKYPSCISFRRGENLIIDDDAEFIPHFIV